KPTDPALRSDAVGPQSRQTRLSEPEISAQNHRQIPVSGPTDPAVRAGSSGSHDRKDPALTADSSGRIRETPLGDRSLEAKEGGSAPPKNGDWERKLKKLFPRELTALKADLIKQQKG